MKGFKDYNVKIIPLFEDIEKIISKKKYQKFFHVGVIGFIHSGFFNNEKLN